MRLWSLHPCYLDAKGLVALWREALLAQKVLIGETRAYRHHPQLQRFQALSRPQAGIAMYLRAVYQEACRRNYQFNSDKIGTLRMRKQITVTSDQVAYEWKHLLAKLKQRDPARFRQQRRLADIRLHPLFISVPGSVEAWEIR